jgi:predicted house-cleaning noncanonical NTP pyrophosphatase (MazG superfamily)
MTYKKLVRDRIPEIILSKGQTPVTRILEQGEYINELLIKLSEEVVEVSKDKVIDELADVKEVLESLTIALGFTIEELQSAQDSKKQKNGGFKEKIYLEDVI